MGASEDGFGGGVLELIGRSSLLAQLVLAILVLFSIASWAVVLFKLRQFRRVESQTTRFRDVFRRSSKFSDVHSVCRPAGCAPG